MFGLARKHDVVFRKEAAKQAAPVLTLVKPAPVAVDLAPLEDRTEYEEIASILGYRPAELISLDMERKRRALIEFCLDKGFPIYDNQEVHNYMSKLADQATEKNYSPEMIKMGIRTVFVWAPLARRERLMAPSVFDRPLVQHGDLSPWDYTKTAPLEMLKRAAAVKAKFPDAEIYVSDYEDVRPDPFIMAKIDNAPHVIFGMWDEPGFGK